MQLTGVLLWPGWLLLPTGTELKSCRLVTIHLTGVLLLAGLAAAAHRYRADAMASAAS